MQTEDAERNEHFNIQFPSTVVSRESGLTGEAASHLLSIMVRGDDQPTGEGDSSLRDSLYINTIMI